jgi:hypothetical protein
MHPENRLRHSLSFLATGLAIVAACRNPLAVKSTPVLAEPVRNIKGQRPRIATTIS